MQKLVLSVIIPVVLLCSIWGCVGSIKGYGTINPDLNVTRSFEAFQVNPNFDYYYSGSEVYPSALIGLDKKIKWEQGLWKKMEITPKDFKDVINQMQAKVLTFRESQHGFTILDDRGLQIGVWYSIPTALTSVKMKDDRTILIYTPPVDTYLKYDNK